MKKLFSLILALCLVLGMASFATAEDELPTFDQIVLGENTDLTAKIHFAYHRTDIPEKLNGYVEEFRKIYPNVEIEYELVTDYAENALMRVGNTDWTIMGIPTVQKDELSKYFVPLGSLETLSTQYNFMSAWSFATAFPPRATPTASCTTSVFLRKPASPNCPRPLMNSSPP